MGMGGYLWIVNATSKTLNLTSQSSNKMNTWAFKSVSPQSMERFYIEYTDENVSKTSSDDSGEATFQLDGTVIELFLIID